jgi:hypothetical protein
MRFDRMALARKWWCEVVIVVLAMTAAGAALGQVSTIYDPIVEKKPPIMVAGAVSAKALKDGSGGVAVMDCLVALDSRLRDCKIAFEAPSDYGFGKAAISKMADYRVRPEGASPNRVLLAVDYRGARQLFEWDTVRPPRGSPGEKIAPSRAASSGVPPPPPPPPPAADAWASLQSNGALVVHRCMIDAAGVITGCEVVFSAGATPVQLAAPYPYTGATAIPVPGASLQPAYFSTRYGRSSVPRRPTLPTRPNN